MSEQKSYLQRLGPGFYRGRAMVHWTMTIDDRRTGWLGDSAHSGFREVLAHTLHRYQMLCPVYCLMPDHLHLVWFGLSGGTDQLRAVSFLRRYFNGALAGSGVALQKQAYDHVLREDEREQGAVESTLFYVAENPVRAELVVSARDWGYSGAMAVGYPDFDWRDEGFSEKLWKIYRLEVDSDVGVKEGGGR